MGYRTAQIGDQPTDETEIRRPANIGNWRDEDFTRLKRCGLGKGMSDPDNPFDHSTRRGSPLQHTVCHAHRLWFQRLRQANGNLREFKALLKIQCNSTGAGTLHR